MLCGARKKARMHAAGSVGPPEQTTVRAAIFSAKTDFLLLIRSNDKIWGRSLSCVNSGACRCSGGGCIRQDDDDDDTMNACMIHSTLASRSVVIIAFVVQNKKHTRLDNLLGPQPNSFRRTVNLQTSCLGHWWNGCGKRPIAVRSQG